MSKYSYYQLRMACQQHMMASLYTEQDDPDAFHAGYVEAVTPRHVLIWCVTPWGEYDGWFLRRTEDILQVFMGDDFEVRLQMLLEMSGVSHTPFFAKEPEPDEDLLRRLLQEAQAENRLVSVMMEEETYTGTVQQVDDLRVSLDTLDFFGAPDGVRQFPLREVQAVSVDTQEEKMYVRLGENRLKLI